MSIKQVLLWVIYISHYVTLAHRTVTIEIRTLAYLVEDGGAVQSRNMEEISSLTITLNATQNAG